MAGKSGGGASGKETEEAGAGGGRRGLVCDFPKVQGPHCNQSSNGNGPKRKSVGFNKVYNFALGFSGKRAKDQQLT
jgi:hypothetical protein